MTEASTAVTEFIDAASLDAFPEEVIREGKRCLLDGIGVILAGSTEASSRIARERVRSFDGEPASLLYGVDPFRAPSALAALVNGVSGHAMDYDDTQLSTSPDRIFGLLTHPTIPPLSAGLGVAERLGASGERFLEAFLTGFEVECKIAEAIDPDHYRGGFHTSGTVGTFGAAVCAAKLLGLGPREIEMTLGIAASMASGIRVNFGTMTKPLHVGRAAQNGVAAAELAAGGFEAGDAPLDGSWGFFQVFGGGFEEEKIVGALGDPHSIVDPGVSVKPYPCGSLSHPSLDAMLELVEEADVRPEGIERVVFRAGKNILEPLRYETADNALEAKFCLPFLLSSIAIRRSAGIREFTDEFVTSEPVQEMMRKVDLVHDREIEAKGFERMRSVIEVELADGRTLVGEAGPYRGGPERPLTREELREKFTECATLVLEPDDVDAAIEAIESIEGLGEIGELSETLTPRAPALKGSAS